MLWLEATPDRTGSLLTLGPLHFVELSDALALSLVKPLFKSVTAALIPEPPEVVLFRPLEGVIASSPMCQALPSQAICESIRSRQMR